MHVEPEAEEQMDWIIAQSQKVRSWVPRKDLGLWGKYRLKRNDAYYHKSDSAHLLAKDVTWVTSNPNKLFNPHPTAPCAPLV